MADTKRKFVEAYKFPIPAVYGNVIQELLVAQHLARYNVNYAYSAVRVPARRARTCGVTRKPASRRRAGEASAARTIVTTSAPF